MRKQLKFWVGRVRKTIHFGYYPNDELFNAAKAELKELIQQKGKNVRRWHLIELNDKFREANGLDKVKRKL